MADGSRSVISPTRRLVPGSLVARALKALLTSRPAMALKRPVKQLWWAAAGATIVNPPVPAGVESVLFVCLGNICRSPFAAALASRRLAERDGATVRCASAGIRTTRGARPPEHACDAAASYGVSLAGHRPVMLTRPLFEQHDLVVVMESRQMTELRSTYPDAADRIVLLSLFDPQPASGEERYVIADPFSQGPDAFEQCYRRIDRAVSHLLAAVAAGTAASPCAARPAAAGDGVS